MEKPRLCIECRHYVQRYDYKNGFTLFDACLSQEDDIDLVNGMRIPKRAYQERTSDGACGIDGDYWEPIDDEVGE